MCRLVGIVTAQYENGSLIVRRPSRAARTAPLSFLGLPPWLVLGYRPPPPPTPCPPPSLLLLCCVGLRRVACVEVPRTTNCVDFGFSDTDHGPPEVPCWRADHEHSSSYGLFSECPTLTVDGAGEHLRSCNELLSGVRAKMEPASINRATGRPESLWLPLRSLPTIRFDFGTPVEPTCTVADSFVWIGLLNDDESADAFDVCRSLSRDVTVENSVLIDGSTTRPMRASMSLCAGPLMDGQLSDLQPKDTLLLSKYSWMGIRMADWQCRPMTDVVFRIVLLAVSRVRHRFPAELRETPPNHVQILPYGQGQYIDWHSDKTAPGKKIAHKSIIDGTGVLTIRCRPKGGPRAVMKFQFGTGLSGDPNDGVVHEFELGGGDVFFMGTQSDTQWKHRTQPHDDHNADCSTIVARWLGLWHPFQVPSTGPAVPAFSRERREEWAAREDAAKEKATNRATSRRKQALRASEALVRTSQPQMQTRSSTGS